MAKGQYIGVNNVARKVKQQYIGVDNVARKVKWGYIGVDNVARECFSSGTPVGDLEVGSSVWMNVDGVATEFLVVHQGLPDATMYDSSCDGTWLLMKDCYKAMQWVTSNTHNYADSDIHSYLNSTFLGLLDQDTQNIIKQIKLPYIYDYYVVRTGANGLSTKAFVLGWTEVGLSANEYCRADGTKLDYFLSGYDTAAHNQRIANHENTAVGWWLRTSYKTSSYSKCFVMTDGSHSFTPASYGSNYVRPALILPSDALVDEDFHVIGGDYEEEPEEPETPDDPSGTIEKTVINLHIGWYGEPSTHTYDGDVIVTWAYNGDAGGTGNLYFNQELAYSGGIYVLAGLSASKDGNVLGANDIPADQVAILKAGNTFTFYLYGISDGEYEEGNTEQGGGIDGTVIKQSSLINGDTCDLCGPSDGNVVTCPTCGLAYCTNCMGETCPYCEGTNIEIKKTKVIVYNSDGSLRGSLTSTSSNPMLRLAMNDSGELYLTDGVIGDDAGQYYEHWDGSIGINIAINAWHPAGLSVSNDHDVTSDGDLSWDSHAYMDIPLTPGQTYTYYIYGHDEI